MENNIRYELEANQVKIEGAFLNFDFPIKQVVEISGILIVRLDIPPKKIYNENVFGVSISDAKIKWQIAKLNYDTGVDCPFTNVAIFEGKLRLNNWCDIYLIIDPMTGAILERSQPMKS